MRGKLTPKVPRKLKDTRDIIETICTTGLSVEQVHAMSPGQRRKVKQEAQEGYVRQFWARHKERDSVWRAWAEAPEPKVHPWKAYLDSIGRADLHAPHCITPLEGGKFIAKDESYD
ncbi:MAG: hypothetical protein ACRD72_20425 [Candidatus Angelobacter sp.]